MPKKKSFDGAAAREAARAAVARQWPELAAVEPTVTRRRRHTLSAAERKRLGVAAAAEATPDVEYTFTFTADLPTADGQQLRRSVSVTVDSQQRVVKIVASR